MAVSIASKLHLRNARLVIAATSVCAYILWPTTSQAAGFEACERPSCASKDDILRMMRDAEANRATPRTGAAAAAADGSITDTQVEKSEDKACDCPPDRAELGFHSWQLLHSIAANYPDEPSETDKVACINLFSALGELYPCRHCAAHLKHSLEAHPPRVDSRAAISQWVCELHNKVNSFLDKPQFPCDQASLDERWLTGHKQCWQQKMESARESLGNSTEVDGSG